MGLVRNLKKRLDDWVNKILVELSYHYITQRAKQTTKKQDNSLQTGFSRSSLTMEPQNTTIATYSQDILEKITMKGTSTEDTVYSTRKWSIARIDEAKPVADKNAIYKEFAEWIELEIGDDDIEVLSLEPLDDYYRESEG